MTREVMWMLPPGCAPIRAKFGVLMDCRSYSVAFGLAVTTACGVGNAEFLKTPSQVAAPTPVPAPTRSPVPSPLQAYEASVYHLESFVDGSGANISDGVASDGAAIIQYPFEGGLNELWTFVAQALEPGAYAIVDPVSQKCATVLLANGAQGQALTLQTCNAFDEQQFWRGTQDANGMTLEHVESQLCLTVQDAATQAGAPLTLAACDGSAAQKWRIKPPVVATGHGVTQFFATPTNQVVAFAMDMTVPPEPLPTGSLFLWPGLQPQARSATYEPLGAGVLQPVLGWGPRCAPSVLPPNYSSWYISGMYVESDTPTDHTTVCQSGAAMTVSPNDVLHISFVLQGNDWTQTITDAATHQSVSYTNSLNGQQMTWVVFDIEEYSAQPVTDVIFQNITWSVAQADPMFCIPIIQGQTDWMTTPVASADGRTCSVDKLILRAQGVAATSPNR